MPFEPLFVPPAVREATGERAWVQAMLDFEAALARAQARAGLLAESVAEEIAAVRVDVDELAAAGRTSGNPAAALVDALPGDAHRGATSQDVMDTAAALVARRTLPLIEADLAEVAAACARLAAEHRGTPMAARTLLQQALPTTFGLKAAGWLTGVLDAYDDVAALVLPVQVGGAAGTMAASVELAGGHPDPVDVAHQVSVELAERLGLTASTPWHTSRASVTRLGDAGTRCTDAWGRIAGDVLALARPEVGELSEGAGGGSSTMPHKSNPVLATLVRRTALTTPQLAATLHLAAAESTDERSAGPWHAEWATLRTLLRHAVVAGDQVTDLLGGLRVHADRMARTLDAALEDLHAEQRSLADLVGRPPRGDYLGATAAFVDAPLARAAAVLAQPLPDPTARPEETP